MKSYMILAQFFRQDGGRDLSYDKLARLSEATKNNRVAFVKQTEDPSGEPIFLFRAERNNMLALVHELVYEQSILDEDLLYDFDSTFQTTWPLIQQNILSEN